MDVKHGSVLVLLVVFAIGGRMAVWAGLIFRVAECDHRNSQVYESSVMNFV